MVILPGYTLPTLCEKISFIHVVPPQLLQLAKREEVDQYDLSTLEEIMCPAAPFSYLTVRELQARLKKILVKNSCGFSIVLGFSTLPSTDLCAQGECRSSRPVARAASRTAIPRKARSEFLFRAQGCGSLTQKR
jgi:hypothetical protein